MQFTNNPFLRNHSRYRNILNQMKMNRLPIYFKKLQVTKYDVFVLKITIA